jgi:hypothetical protein
MTRENRQRPFTSEGKTVDAQDLDILRYTNPACWFPFPRVCNRATLLNGWHGRRTLEPVGLAERNLAPCMPLLARSTGQWNLHPSRQTTFPGAYREDYPFGKARAGRSICPVAEIDMVLIQEGSSQRRASPLGTEHECD